MYATRLVRLQPHHLSSPFQSSVRRETASLRFRAERADEHVKQDKSQQEMEQEQEQHDKKETGDIMHDSFGPGYSTRSEEEGFGGIYGGRFPKEEEDKGTHETHPNYDTTQGSEVKQEEKGRHQHEKMAQNNE